MLRTTPLHLLFPDGQIDQSRFDRVLEQARDSDQDVWNPLAVSALPEVGAWVSELRPGSEDPHAVHAYSALVFYGMHVLSKAGTLLVVSEPVGRGLAAAQDPNAADPWPAQPPTSAGYLQLPHNLFWVQTGVESEVQGEEAPSAEPLDGIFWASGPGPEHQRGLWVMMAAGVRPGRPGFSAIALDRIPFGDVKLWADREMRGEGDDFANLLPGGDLAGFLTVATAGEALKLLARAWRQVHVEGTTATEAQTSGTALHCHVLNPTHHGDDGQRK